MFIIFKTNYIFWSFERVQHTAHCTLMHINKIESVWLNIDYPCLSNRCTSTISNMDIYWRKSNGNQYTKWMHSLEELIFSMSHTHDGCESTSLNKNAIECYRGSFNHSFLFYPFTYFTSYIWFAIFYYSSVFLSLHIDCTHNQTHVASF